MNFHTKLVREKRRRTFTEDRNLLDGSNILEEVVVEEGDGFSVVVCDDGLYVGVADLAESDIELTAVHIADSGRGCGGHEGGGGSDDRGELHDGGKKGM